MTGSFALVLDFKSNLSVRRVNAASQKGAVQKWSRSSSTRSINGEIERALWESLEFHPNAPIAIDGAVGVWSTSAEVEGDLSLLTIVQQQWGSQIDLRSAQKVDPRLGHTASVGHDPELTASDFLTFVLTYLGGTYVKQVGHQSLRDAATAWLDSLPLQVPHGRRLVTALAPVRSVSGLDSGIWSSSMLRHAAPDNPELVVVRQGIPERFSRLLRVTSDR